MTLAANSCNQALQLLCLYPWHFMELSFLAETRLYPSVHCSKNKIALAATAYKICWTRGFVFGTPTLQFLSICDRASWSRTVLILLGWPVTRPPERNMQPQRVSKKEVKKTWKPGAILDFWQQLLQCNTIELFDQYCMKHALLQNVLLLR